MKIKLDEFIDDVTFDARLTAMKTKLDKFCVAIIFKMTSQEANLEQIFENHASSIYNIEV